MELISAMEGDSPPAVAAARLDDLHFKDDMKEVKASKYFWDGLLPG